jgi:thymidylate kinase
MPERIVVIDGTQTEAEIERQTWKVVKKAIA